MTRPTDANKKSFGSLTFGFDIGIASVGWAVLNETRVVDLGVRCFTAAENPKDGTTNNQARRGARVSRNRFRMRRWRLARLRELFELVGIFPDASANHLIQKPRIKSEPDTTSPWALRSRALTEKLNHDDWARVFYHLAKRRGFAVARSIELTDPASAANVEPTTASQSGEKPITLVGGLSRTSALLTKYGHLQTIGNIAFSLPRTNPDTADSAPFAISKRNKRDRYENSFRRSDLQAELEVLLGRFTAQYESLANQSIPEHPFLIKRVYIRDQHFDVPAIFKEQVKALFLLQRPPIVEEQMQQLIGECEFEANELRAPKNCFSNERRTWLEKLNHLRVVKNGKTDSLEIPEREAILSLPYENETVTYADIRAKLVKTCGFSADYREASFVGLNYRQKLKENCGWVFVHQKAELTEVKKWFKQNTAASTKEQRKAQTQKLTEIFTSVETGQLTYLQLRARLGLPATYSFVHKVNQTENLARVSELHTFIPFGANERELFETGMQVKQSSSGDAAIKLSKIALRALYEVRALPKAQQTFSQLRAHIDKLEPPRHNWQFCVVRKLETHIGSGDEEQTPIPLEFENAQATEDARVVRMEGWHKIRKALHETDQSLWGEFTVAYLAATTPEGRAKAEALDRIAEILTIGQSDEGIGRELSKMSFSTKTKEALLGVSMTGYKNLSLVAIRNILPGLESGKNYSDACKQAGYKNQQFGSGERKKYLDLLPTIAFKRYRIDPMTAQARANPRTEKRYKGLNNPTVARSFNQARKVLNELIARYGSPAYVNIETARDLSRSKKKRDEIADEQKARRDRNFESEQAARTNFAEKYGNNEATKTQIRRMRMYAEQNCKCAYTLEPLDPRQILSNDNYVNEDHIWPRSKTFDNSIENKVLVLAGANQNKGDLIPYNFLGGDRNSELWQRFQHWVNECHAMSGAKKERLLSIEIDELEFYARNLVDTRYVTRLFARLLRENLLFAGEDGKTRISDESEENDPDAAGALRIARFNVARVRTPQGGVTALLRRSWGFAMKDRTASDLHHALDACVIAAVNPTIIQAVNNYHRRMEQFEILPGGRFFDKATGAILKSKAAQFPTPQGIEHFRGEVLARLSPDGRTAFLKNGERFEFGFVNYSQEERDAIKPVIVSRVVKRVTKNEVHSANPNGITKLREKPKSIWLKDLTASKLNPELLDESFYAKYKPLIDALALRLKKYGDNGARAFADPFFWPLESEIIVNRIRLPLKPPKKIKRVAETTTHEIHKRIKLTALTLKMLTLANLGEQYYTRNRLLIDALAARLTQHGGKAAKAFIEPFYKPSVSKDPGKLAPRVTAVRLPETANNYVEVRGGVAGFGDSLYTQVFHDSKDKNFVFRHKYLAPSDVSKGLDCPPDGAVFLCNIRIDDFIEITLEDGEFIQGYFVGYESDGRISVRTHDRPGKAKPKKAAAEAETGDVEISEDVEEVMDSYFRRSTSQIRQFQKLKVSVLGDVTIARTNAPNGLA